MHIIELKIGTIMNSVSRCTKASTTEKSENSRNSSGCWMTPSLISRPFIRPLRPRNGIHEIMRTMFEVRNGNVEARKQDRKSVETGTSVSDRVDLRGHRRIKKKN